MKWKGHVLFHDPPFRILIAEVLEYLLGRFKWYRQRLGGHWERWTPPNQWPHRWTRVRWCTFDCPTILSSLEKAHAITQIGITIECEFWETKTS